MGCQKFDPTSKHAVGIGWLTDGRWILVAGSLFDWFGSHSVPGPTQHRQGFSCAKNSLVPQNSGFSFPLPPTILFVLGPGRERKKTQHGLMAAKTFL